MAARPSSESLVAAFLSRYSNEKTRRTYGVAFNGLTEWAATHGVAHVADIQKPHLDLYAVELEKQGLSQNSRAGKQGVIKRFYDYLVTSGTIKQTPVPPGWVPTQIIAEKNIDPLTDEEVESLYGAARERGDFLDLGMVIALAGWEGMTLGQIKSLHAEDVKEKGGDVLAVPIRRRDGTIHNKPLTHRSSRHLALVVADRPSGSLFYPDRPSDSSAQGAMRRGLASVGRDVDVVGSLTVSRLWWSFRARMLSSGSSIEVVLESIGLDGSRGGGSYSRRIALPKHGPESEGNALRSLALHELNAAELLRQAEHLCDQDGITPIAPIVIAGAALEMVLRRMCEASDVEVASRQPGISAYADALKRRTLISKFSHQQLQAHAKLRNDAAHGVESAEVTIDHAKVMIRSIGLFLSGEDD